MCKKEQTRFCSKKEQYTLVPNVEFFFKKKIAKTLVFSAKKYS